MTTADCQDVIANNMTTECPISKMLPIRIISKVVKGFGRGSSDLGIPTANVSPDNMKCNLCFENLPCGIYWGFARIGEKQKNNDKNDPNNILMSYGVVHKAAISIGYNPTYGNKEKTVEPHLIAPPDHPKRHASCCGETQLQEFYEQPIRLSVVGYLRPELPFEGLEKLTKAIKNDIVNAEKMGDSTDENSMNERNWVDSSLECVPSK